MTAMPPRDDKGLTSALDVVLETPIPYEVLQTMALVYQADWGGLDYIDQNAILHECRKLATVFLESMKNTPRAPKS